MSATGILPKIDSYVLRYAYNGVPTPGWHDVSVRVLRRGTFDVRARRGYLAGKE